MKTRIMVLALLAFPLTLAGCARQQPIASTPLLPAQLSPTGLKGYRAGVAAARQDIRLHEPPDVGIHLRYQNPPVLPQFAKEYRQEFRAGYELAIHGGSPAAGY